MAQLRLPPMTPGVDIMVLLQMPPPMPEALLPAGRPDIRLVLLDSVGVAQSRNAALEQAQGTYLLFADDDVALDMGGVLAIRAHLRDHPALDMAVGRLLGPGPARNAPRAKRLRLTNSAHIGTPQLMVRRDRIRARGILFDTRFGLGARHPLGEEFIFVTDALKAGLRGVHLPLAVGAHPHQSSGTNWADQTLLHARAAVLQRVFGRAVLPFALVFAWRHRAHMGGLRGMAGFVVRSLRRP